MQQNERDGLFHGHCWGGVGWGGVWRGGGVCERWHTDQTWLLGTVTVTEMFPEQTSVCIMSSEATVSGGQQQFYKFLFCRIFFHVFVFWRPLAHCIPTLTWRRGVTLARLRFVERSMSSYAEKKGKEMKVICCHRRERPYSILASPWWFLQFDGGSRSELTCRKLLQCCFFLCPAAPLRP